MKNLIHLNEENLYWPIIDKRSWSGQQKQAEIYNHIRPYLKHNRVMVQAGGNCGYILGKFVPNFDHIYTFEPDPVNFYCLNLNIQNINVTKFQACLGNVRELVGLFNYLPDIGGVHVKGNGYTPCIVLDDLNLPICDLIQLDIEGYELNAIKGSINTIKRCSPTLCIEWCEKWATRYNSTYTELEALLTELKYVHVANSGVDNIYIKK